MEQVKIYGVYTQNYPDWKYEPCLESIWTTKEAALEAAKDFKDDWVWVLALSANNTNMYGDSEESFMVKKPKDKT